MAALPGGASGLLCRDYKGKEADRLVTRIDPGVVSLLAELRGHERQAAEELEQWMTRAEEPTPLDASPAVITLTMICTLQEALSAGTIALEISSRNSRVAGAPKALGPAARRPRIAPRREGDRHGRQRVAPGSASYRKHFRPPASPSRACPSFPAIAVAGDGRPQPRASRRLHRTTFQESSLLEYPRLKPKGRVGPAGHRNHRRERITRP
jgi:hypothetical protein